MQAVVLANPAVLDHAPMLVFMVFVIGMIAVLMGVPYLLAKRSHGDVKGSPYECGLPAVGSAKQRFSVHFYLVALLFILFDIEAVFLFPWALAVQRLGVLGFVEALVFVAILGLGLGYAWRKGVLDWN